MGDLKGIDVSSYQKKIDWEKVKQSGVEFAILKIIRKDLQLDNQFNNNVIGCVNNKIPFSVYNYSYATTREKAKRDAEVVVTYLENKKGSKIKYFNKYVWLDIEHETQLGLGHLLVDIVKEYQNVIEDAGFKFGVYTGLSFYNTEFKKYSSEFDFPFWIARYPSKANMLFIQNPNEVKKPNIINELWGWQYTSYGIINGIGGNVDFNICYEEDKRIDNLSGVQKFSLRQNGSQNISKNFKVREFRCKDGSDEILIDVDFVRNVLQRIRDYYHSPLTINSAYRNPEYNKRIRGARSSYHTKGMAFDVVLKNHTPLQVARVAQELGVNGIILYDTFVHLDSRETKYWARNHKGVYTPVNIF